jgi:hypothetical protein
MEDNYIAGRPTCARSGDDLYSPDGYPKTPVRGTKKVHGSARRRAWLVAEFPKITDVNLRPREAGSPHPERRKRSRLARKDDEATVTCSLFFRFVGIAH